MKKITYCYPWVRLSLEEKEAAMREFADAGERYVVLTSGLLEEGCAKTENLLSFRDLLKKYSLDFADAHAPWGNWSDPGNPLEEYRKILVERQKMALRLCALMGVDTMAYHTGNTWNSIYGKDLTLEDYYNALIRSLEELLPVAEECNVIMALENQWTPLNQSAILLKVMDYFKSPYLGLCYDTGHGNLTENGKDFPNESCVPLLWNDLGVEVQWEESLLEKFQPHLVNCHLSDNLGHQDDHFPPGKCKLADWKQIRTVNWERVRNVLNNAPRLRCIQNESTKPADMTIGEFCSNFRNILGM